MGLNCFTKMEEAIPGRGQDRISVRRHHHGALSLIMADGAGGVSGGAETASIICDALSLFIGDDIQKLPTEHPATWLSHIDELMHGNLHHGLAAAIALTIADDGKIIGASVGDCQAWIFDDGLPSIELTSGQHRKPLLGEGKATPVGFEGELGKRMLIVATDGLWKYAALSSIASTMRLRNSNPLLSTRSPIPSSTAPGSRREPCRTTSPSQW